MRPVNDKTYCGVEKGHGSIHYGSGTIIVEVFGGVTGHHINGKATGKSEGCEKWNDPMKIVNSPDNRKRCLRETKTRVKCLI